MKLLDQDVRWPGGSPLRTSRVSCRSPRSPHGGSKVPGKEKPRSAARMESFGHVVSMGQATPPPQLDPACPSLLQGVFPPGGA